MKLKGKNIILTGGTTGIGREMVKLLKDDNRILVIASNKNRLDSLSSEFNGISTRQVDLASIEEINDASEYILREHDKVDILINNAAVQYLPKFTDESFNIDGIEEEVAINFTAVCRLTSLLLPALKKSSRGVIVNVNSGLALAPKTTSAIYCATKAALDNFSRSLRYQLESSNVDVLQAFLPLVETPMTEGRGSGKMLASDAARAIIQGIEQGRKENYIGKSKLLAVLMRIAPSIARNIMKKS